MRRIVYDKTLCRIYHYCEPPPRRRGIQSKEVVLIVFAAINRATILDLSPQCSFINDLARQNLDVYLLEWQKPVKKNRSLDLQDYLQQLRQAVHFLAKHTDKAINVIGICQGGVFMLDLLANDAHSNVKNLALITTPIDFHADDFILSHLLRKIAWQDLTALPIIPGIWLRNFFVSLNPIDLVGRKLLRLIEKHQDENWLKRFLQVEKWFQNMPNQHSMALVQFIDRFFNNNYFIKTKTLKKINLPILNIIAEKDKLISAQSTKALSATLKNKDVTEKTFPAGHIGIYVNDAVRRAMTQTIADWLQSRCN